MEWMDLGSNEMVANGVKLEYDDVMMVGMVG
jgi:hypothetical protein